MTRGRGVTIPPKTDDVIYEQPLIRQSHRRIRDALRKKRDYVGKISIYYPKLLFFVKTKNVPKMQNKTIFFCVEGVFKWGGGRI